MFNKILVAVLAIQMSLLPTVRASSANSVEETAVKPFSLIRSLKTEVEKNQEQFFPPSMTAPEALTTSKSAAMTSLAGVLRDLKDPSIDLNGIKARLVSQVQLEEQAQSIEIGYILDRMTTAQLDQVFAQAISRGANTEDLQAKYKLAYSAKEKAEVLAQMVRGELSLMKSRTLKDLGSMERADLVEQLNATESILTAKGFNWKVALVIGLTIAVSGLVSWAIVSATKSRYDKKTKDLIEKEKQKNISLEQEFEAKEAQLRNLFADREALREGGYTWQVCSTRQEARTVYCTYDKRTHSGGNYCVTRCLRNAQGASVQQAESCTSAAIPSNCFLPNPYDLGLSTGRDEGYRRGFENAYDEYYDDAYRDYSRKGRACGRDSGYDRGYSDGYYDGYHNQIYDSSPPSYISIPSESSCFYTGYDAGYAQAQQLVVGQ